MFPCDVYNLAQVKLVVFDFDKTITKRHTQGSVGTRHKAEPEFILENFADLDFLLFSVPFIQAQSIKVGGEAQVD